MQKVDLLRISRREMNILKKVINVAIEFERVFGKKLNVTGEIGEVLVCQKLGLKLDKNARAEGYDAIDGKGRKVQIKTRRSEKDDLPKMTGRLSRFSNHPCDDVVVALLDRSYRLRKFWKVPYSKVKKLKQREKSGPSISAFKRIAERQSRTRICRH